MGKRLPGVRPRGNSVQIDLIIDGQRARFSLPVPPTTQALEYASNVRAAAKLDIAKGTFDATKYFPQSKSKFVKNLKLKTVECALLDFLKNSKNHLSPSTYRDYASAIHYHLIPSFGHYCLDELSIEIVRRWIVEQDISPKRTNNVMIPLRAVFGEAYSSGLLARNPMQRIKNLPHRPREADPFTIEEISKILGSCEGFTNDLFKFAFWSGLRTSELIALEWSDVNFKLRKAYVNKAEVRGVRKPPKTLSGVRSILIVPPAFEALSAARARLPHDRTRVFLNPRTKNPWSSDGQIRKTAWLPTIKSANVRYRPPYQTRHTFASQMLTLGFDPMWVASQMGHRDWGMIRRVYGRWMQESRPDIERYFETKMAQIGHVVS